MQPQVIQQQGGVIIPVLPTSGLLPVSGNVAAAVGSIGALHGHANLQQHGHAVGGGGIIGNHPQSTQQAYINFNLSTICPEINAAFVPHPSMDKLSLLPTAAPPTPVPHPLPLLQHPPPTSSQRTTSLASGKHPVASSSNTPVAGSIAKSSTGHHNIGGVPPLTGSIENDHSQEMMSGHGIAILGDGAHQVCTFQLIKVGNECMPLKTPTTKMS